jgi:hypothetical protein
MSGDRSQDGSCLFITTELVGTTYADCNAGLKHAFCAKPIAAAMAYKTVQDETSTPLGEYPSRRFQVGLTMIRST